MSRITAISMSCMALMYAGGMMAQSPQAVDALKEVEAFFAETHHEKLPVTVERWKKKTRASDRKDVLVRLVKHLGSTKETFLADSDKLVVSQIEKPGLKKDGHIIARHDLRMEGGRASYAIEELLDCELPYIPAQATDSERQLLIRAAYEKVIETMLLPVGLHDAKERARLAGVRGLDRFALLELSKDADTVVRRAAAGNRSLPLRYLRPLLKDPDASVREAAERNYEYARLTDDD